MQCSYVIVQLLSSWRLQGFKRRPSLPLRQGLTPPLTLWRGLWPSQIGTAWASALPSLPAADIRVTSWAERRSAGDTGEGDSEGEGNIHGQEPTYCVHSLLLCYFFTHPSPILTSSSFILQLTDSDLHIFLFLLFTSVSRHVSVPSTPPSRQLPWQQPSADIARSVQ